ncbi:MAG: hypothetical protein M1480_02205 [Bacteroidetes bacterium]|nr:hypothetical protein [Bacteroidota bacterium]
MKKLSKLIFPLILAGVLAVIYFTYFAPTKELGSFSKFSSGAEINQNINVRVDKSMKFERDANGNIISFYVLDKNNVKIQVTSHEPILPEIADADIVELLGHMHGGNFTAGKITILK